MAKSTCQNCGGEFTRPGKTVQKYCSPGCYRESRWGTDRSVVRRCLTCDVEFSSHLSDKRKYCSKTCYEKSGAPRLGKRNRVSHACDWCGTVFERAASNFHSTVAFCCHSCAGMWHSHYGPKGTRHAHWKGGVAPEAYRTQWEKARKLAMKRSGNRCAICERDGIRLLVHHKIPIQAFTDPRKANKIDNLMVICHQCHARLHHGVQKKVQVVQT